MMLDDAVNKLVLPLLWRVETYGQVDLGNRIELYAEAFRNDVWAYEISIVHAQGCTAIVFVGGGDIQHYVYNNDVSVEDAVRNAFQSGVLF